MKKLFFSAMAAVAILATSCSSKTTDAQAEDEGAALKAKIENCTNPDSLKIYVQQAKDYAAKLVKEGNDSAAQAFLDEVTPVVTTKDPSAASLFDKMEEKADSLLEVSAEKVDSLKDKAADAVNAAKDAAKDKATEVANAAKEKAADAANAAKDKINDAKGAASDAVQKGAENLKNAFK